MTEAEEIIACDAMTAVVVRDAFPVAVSGASCVRCAAANELVMRLTDRQAAPARSGRMAMRRKAPPSRAPEDNMSEIPTKSVMPGLYADWSNRTRLSGSGTAGGCRSGPGCRLRDYKRKQTPRTLRTSSNSRRKPERGSSRGGCFAVGCRIDVLYLFYPHFPVRSSQSSAARASCEKGNGTRKTRPVALAQQALKKREILLDTLRLTEIAARILRRPPEVQSSRLPHTFPRLGEAAYPQLGDVLFGRWN